MKTYLQFTASFIISRLFPWSLLLYRNPLDTSSFNLDASDPRENLEELICCIEQKMTSSAFFKKARLIDRLDGMILAGITDEEAEG